MNTKQFNILIFNLFASMFFGQQNQPYQNGEKIIDEKVRQYHKIDTLNFNSPLKANLKGEILDYEVNLIEGEIKIQNIGKKIFGSGGFSVYKFVNKETKNLLKIEYHQTKHLYSDHNQKQYMNSEIQRISIYFNKNNKPDFAKVLENQYTSEKVISSQLYYLNLSEEKQYFTSSESEKLINYIFEIVSTYK